MYICISEVLQITTPLSSLSTSYQNSTKGRITYTSEWVLVQKFYLIMDQVPSSPCQKCVEPQVINNR